MTALPFVRPTALVLVTLTLLVAATATPTVVRAQAGLPPHSPPSAPAQPGPAQPGPAQPGPAQPAPGQPGQATPAPATPNAGPPTPSENLTPGELNRLFEAYAILQAQNMLRLTDDQYADFIIRLRSLQAARRRHQQTRQKLISELRKLTNPQNTTADEASMKTALESLTRVDATAHEEIRQATEQVDELLDIRQRARFRVFEENLERWKLDLLSRVRRAARDKPRPPKS